MNSNFKEKKKLFISSLLLIFPIALISGPVIPELIMIISLIAFLYFGQLKNTISKIDNLVIFFFLLFLIYLLFSSTLAYLENSNFNSFKNSLFYFRYGVIILLTIYILNNFKEFYKYFYYVFSVLFIIIFFDQLKQVITGYNFFNMPLYGGRSSSFFGDELILGSFLIKILPIFIMCCFYQKIKNQNIFFFLLISGVSIFLTGERTAFFSYIFFIFFVSLLLLDSKKYLFLFLSVITTLAILGILFTGAGNRIYASTIKQIFVSEKKLVLFSVRHQMHYETAWNIFKDYPFFGAGPNQFRNVCDKKKFHPVNTLNFKYLYAPENSSINLNLLYNNKKTIIDIEKLLNSKKNKNSYKAITADQIILYLKKENYLNYTDTEIPIISLDLISTKDQNNVQSFILKNKDEIYLSKKYSKNEKIVHFTKFKNFSFDNGCNTHPHNFHLQFLSELGIFGYLFLLVFIFILLKDIYIIIKYKNKISYFKEQYVIMIGILINFSPFFPSGNFFNNWLSMILFYPIGFYIYFKQLNKKY